MGLTERLEEAHKLVRKKTGQAIMRQIHYHDKNLNWRKFEVNDDVFVYFPRTKMGQSPTLTSYWRGPYQVISKMSDVTYVENCGPRGSNQVIHVDRMRLKNSQLLVGEKDENCQEDAKHSIDGDNDISLVEDDKFNQSSPKNDAHPE